MPPQSIPFLLAEYPRLPPECTVQPYSLAPTKPYAGLAASLQLPHGAVNALEPHDQALMRSVAALLASRDLGSLSIRQVRMLYWSEMGHVCMRRWRWPHGWVQVWAAGQDIHHLMGGWFDILFLPGFTNPRAVHLCWPWFWPTDCLPYSGPDASCPCCPTHHPHMPALMHDITVALPSFHSCLTSSNCALIDSVHLCRCRSC
jgi:hypothetical protein